MEPWTWAIVGVVPVVAVGAAYAMGAFSTKTAAINEQIENVQRERNAFQGDVDEQGNYIGGKHRKKTKKSKSKHKKTKRHSK